jgi:hypothetical protein
LLYEADTIVLLEVSWLVAVWRIIRRHVTKSLHGTNPYQVVNGVKALFKLIEYACKYPLNKVGSDASVTERMRKYLEEQKDSAEPPTPESVSRDVEQYLSISVPPTAEFVHTYLEKYSEKVLLAFLRVRDGLRFDGLYVIHQRLRLHVLLDFVLEDAAQNGDGVGVGGIHAKVGEAARAQVLAACVGGI